jgi:putative tryptophan/tyrosine transport system substrate-binding protein
MGVSRYDSWASKEQKMRRRDFLGVAGAAAAGWPLSAHAQSRQNIPRVGYLFSFTQAEGDQLWQACRRGLQELGYVEGQNIVLEPRLAEGVHERLPKLAAELVQLKVNVIVAAATPASRAAKAATSTIPIVFVAVGDPVTVKLIASLARPGGNVTGLSLLTSDVSGKRLSLLVETVRKSSRVGILMNPDNPISAVFFEETKLAARQLGIELQQLHARDPRQIAQALSDAAEKRFDAIVVFDDPVLWSHRAQIVGLTAAAKIPAMYGYRDFVDGGGLMSYGPDRSDQYRRTAIYVDKILKGAKPSDLPVEQPTKFELIVNRKAARALGVELPTSVLLAANEVIE